MEKFKEEVLGLNLKHLCRRHIREDHYTGAITTSSPKSSWPIAAFVLC